MKPFALSALLVFASSLWAYQSPALLAAPAANHGVLPVRLAKSIDSKKAKTGDPIVTETTALVRTADGTVITTGTKVIGHLTDAAALSKGDADSSLGMVFDKIEMNGGKELNIKGTLQAIAPAPESDTGAAGPGTMPQFGNDGGTMPPPAAPTADSNPKKSSAPTLNAQSRGVLGFRDLEMGVDSVLTSSAKQIKLNSGTQMMLEVQFK